MQERLARIIKREKALYPGQPVPVLLLRRLWAAGAYKIGNGYKSVVALITKDSTFNSTGELSQCSLFPEKLLNLVVDIYHPSSILDVGCGVGTALDFYTSKGIDAIGIENSSVAISLAKQPERIHKRNLNQPVKIDRAFDLVWCFEVIEHIHPKFESAILDTLTGHANTIVLSAARPGQGGFGHFNEQLPEYWIEKFAARGFTYQSEITEQFRRTGDICSNNIICLTRN